MPSSIAICPEDNCVEVVHRGALTLAELYDIRAETSRLLASHRWTRVLVDGRQADIATLSIADAFQFNASHGSEPPLTRTTIAVVIPSNHSEQAIFSETVARNRGINLRVFFDPLDARKWLTEVG